MKITEISVGVSRTFNLGDFNSLRLEAGATASVEEGEIEAAREELLKEVRVSLVAAYKAHYPPKKPSHD